MLTKQFHGSLTTYKLTIKKTKKKKKPEKTHKKNTI